MKKQTMDNRQIILQTAAQLFAEKGFDGARVDEIAKRAKVNKALIYYYFKSKEEILSVLFREVLEESSRFINSPAFESPDVMRNTPEMIRFMNSFIDYLETRQDILRVMLMESLKRSPVNDLIFSVIGEFMRKISEKVGEISHNSLEPAQVMVTEFFTGIMPCINFVVFHEKWMERFGIDEPELRERFFKAFLGTHMEHTLKTYQMDNKADDDKT
jgi:TetR/AcrR family transcriptional regulator